MFDLRRLRLLREVQLRGTLAAVADALAYSPSAISQQLALLEKEAGTPLLRKIGRRVQLTPQGEVLAAHAGLLLDGLERAESDLEESLDRVSGTLRLAVFQSAAHAFMPQALTALAAEHPELRVETVERQPETGLFELLARDFDLVIAEQYPGHTRAHHDDLDREQLCTDLIHLTVAPEQTDIRSLSDARHLPWVMEPEGTASRAWATQRCRAAGFEPDVRFETADLMAHIRLVNSGNAVSLLPDLVWAGERPSVAVINLDDNPRREVFSSARRAGAERKAVRLVRDALAAAAAHVSTPGT